MTTSERLTWSELMKRYISRGQTVRGDALLALPGLKFAPHTVVEPEESYLPCAFVEILPDAYALARSIDDEFDDGFWVDMMVNVRIGVVDMQTDSTIELEPVLQEFLLKIGHQADYASGLIAANLHEPPPRLPPCELTSEQIMRKLWAAAGPLDPEHN